MAVHSGVEHIALINARVVPKNSSGTAVTKQPVRAHPETGVFHLAVVMDIAINQPARPAQRSSRGTVIMKQIVAGPGGSGASLHQELHMPQAIQQDGAAIHALHALKTSRGTVTARTHV